VESSGGADRRSEEAVMHALTPWTVDRVRARSTRAARPSLTLVVITLVLAAAAVWYMIATSQTTGRAVAMTAECHQAYRGYMAATDQAEADFWAESWMTFGCETGGGYWA
jgi:hypothetical protein